jgi:hypothetical protein
LAIFRFLKKIRFLFKKWDSLSSFFTKQVEQ